MDIASGIYLSDAHLHTALAEQLYPILTLHSLDEGKVKQILQKIPRQIGGGKRKFLYT